MKLSILQYGRHPLTGAPVPGYVIELDDGSIVLVDTGFPTIGPHDRVPARFRVTPDDHVVRRLAILGLRPRDVRFLVCSHFDPDHSGSHDLFPGSECIVQRSHYVVARSGRDSRFEIHRSRWDHPALRYRLVDGDTELAPGVDLIETSGHVPGHQSVLVRLPNTGAVLLAVDAIPIAAQADPHTRRPHPFDADPARAARSAAKLAEICEREQVRLIVYGHDAEQWGTLRLAPACYT